MYDLNSIQNSIFTPINSVYIKSEKYCFCFCFFQVFTLSLKTFMTSPQSPKNIIYQPKFISNHIFMSTFVDNNEI